MPMADGTKSNIVMWSQGILAAFLALAIYLMQDTRRDVKTLSNKVASISESIATISGNRFTSHDGMEVYKLINQIQAKVENLPPEQWRAKVIELEARMNQLERNVGTNR